MTIFTSRVVFGGLVQMSKEKRPGASSIHPFLARRNLLQQCRAAGLQQVTMAGATVCVSSGARYVVLPRCLARQYCCAAVPP